MMTTKEVEADLARFAQQFRERLAIIFIPSEIAIYDRFTAQGQPMSRPDKTAEEQAVFAKLFADREAAWLYERCTLLAYELRYRQQHGSNASAEPADPTADE
jgi:hypothetical protein